MKLTLKVLPLITLAAALATTGALAQETNPKPKPPGATPSPAHGSAMDRKGMRSQMMAQMRTQMDQMQTLMKENMAKMAAADEAMKSHMETAKASMKSQMELQHAVISHLQTMTDHMQKMHEGMSMMPAMDMSKKSGAKATHK